MSRVRITGLPATMAVRLNVSQTDVPRPIHRGNSEPDVRACHTRAELRRSRVRKRLRMQRASASIEACMWPAADSLPAAVKTRQRTTHFNVFTNVRLQFERPSAWAQRVRHGPGLRRLLLNALLLLVSPDRDSASTMRHLHGAC